MYRYGKFATGAPGVTLSLELPRRTYFRNALTRATMTLQNASASAMHLSNASVLYVALDSDPVERILDNPAIETIRADGLRYPGTLTRGGGRRGGSGLVLEPGDILTRNVYVILRAPIVQARADIVTTVGNTLLHTRIVSEPISVDLVTGEAPSIVLHTSPDVYAEIGAPTPAEGPLIYIWYWVCTDAGSCGSTTASELFVRELPTGARLDPHWPDPCNAPHWWRAVAGWLDHPAAFLVYP